jgi:hypothetical protein
MAFIPHLLATLPHQTTLSQKCKFSILFLFLMLYVKFWIYFGHSRLSVDDWIFYARDDYASQSWRESSVRTLLIAIDRLRTTWENSIFVHTYHCTISVRYFLHWFSRRPTRKRMTLKIHTCGAVVVFEWPEENHTMPKCGLHTKYLPATFAWILLLGTTGAFFYYP